MNLDVDKVKNGLGMSQNLDVEKIKSGLSSAQPKMPSMPWLKKS